MILGNSHKQKVWFRVTALLTLAFFTVTNTGLADLSSVYSQKAPSANPDTLNLSAASLLGSTEDALPEEFGQIKKSFQGGRNKILIHIQDAHANEEAQRNIAKIIGYFAQHDNLKTVALEGAEGELATELLSFFPNKKVLRAVSDFNLSQARMNGSEYAAIVENPSLRLYGVEEDALYEKNRHAYLEALENQKKDESILEQLGKILQNLTRFVFSDKLRELNSSRKHFYEEGRDLSAYVAYLVRAAKENGMSLYDFPHMQSLLSLIDLEESIDFDEAEKEIDLLIGDLKTTISRERLSRFLTNTVQFRMKKMKRSDYYGYLEEEMKSSNSQSLGDKYSHVLSYLRYIRTYDSISLEIFDEIEKLETALKNKFFKSQDEIDLDRLLKIFEVYQRLFDFSLTKQDADFFFAFRKDFNSATFSHFLPPLLNKYHFSDGLPSDLEILDKDLERIERYYELAVQRDHVLIQNTVEKMDKENLDIIVLVTGGFHTPGIEAYLKEHDYSYMVIAPRISKASDHKLEERLYQDALNNKPLPLEKKLIEAFFPPNSGMLKDPRFQLAVRPSTPPRSLGAAAFMPTETNRLFPATEALLAGLTFVNDPEKAEQQMISSVPQLASEATHEALRNLIQRVTETGMIKENAGGHTRTLFSLGADGTISGLVVGAQSFLTTAVTEIGLRGVPSERMQFGTDGAALIVTVDRDRVGAVFPGMPELLAAKMAQFEARTPNTTAVFPQSLPELLAWMSGRAAADAVLVQSIHRLERATAEAPHTFAFVRELAAAQSEFEQNLGRSEVRSNDGDLMNAATTLRQKLAALQRTASAAVYTPLIEELKGLPGRVQGFSNQVQSLIGGSETGADLSSKIDELAAQLETLQAYTTEVLAKAATIEDSTVGAAREEAQAAIVVLYGVIETTQFEALAEKLKAGPPAAVPAPAVVSAKTEVKTVVSGQETESAVISTGTNAVEREPLNLLGNAGAVLPAFQKPVIAPKAASSAGKRIWLQVTLAAAMIAVSISTATYRFTEVLKGIRGREPKLSRVLGRRAPTLAKGTPWLKF